MDHMIRLHRSGKTSRRWTLTFFFDMIDISLLNACIIYRALQRPNPQQRNRFRRQFLLDAGYELLNSFLTQRCLPGQKLTPRVKTSLQLLGFCPAISEEPLQNSERRKKKRCFLCERGRDFKTTRQCDTCHQFVCQRHSQKISSVFCISCK